MVALLCTLPSSLLNINESRDWNELELYPGGTKITKTLNSLVA